MLVPKSLEKQNCGICSILEQIQALNDALGQKADITIQATAPSVAQYQAGALWYDTGNDKLMILSTQSEWAELGGGSSAGAYTLERATYSLTIPANASGNGVVLLDPPEEGYIKVATPIGRLYSSGITYTSAYSTIVSSLNVMRLTVAYSSTRDVDYTVNVNFMEFTIPAPEGYTGPKIILTSAQSLVVPNALSVHSSNLINESVTISAGASGTELIQPESPGSGLMKIVVPYSIIQDGAGVVTSSYLWPGADRFGVDYDNSDGQDTNVYVSWFELNLNDPTGGDRVICTAPLQLEAPSGGGSSGGGADYWKGSGLNTSNTYTKNGVGSYTWAEMITDMLSSTNDIVLDVSDGTISSNPSLYRLLTKSSTYVNMVGIGAYNNELQTRRIRLSTSNINYYGLSTTGTMAVNYSSLSGSFSVGATFTLYNNYDRGGSAVFIQLDPTLSALLDNNDITVKVNRTASYDTVYIEFLTAQSLSTQYYQTTEINRANNQLQLAQYIVVKSPQTGISTVPIL